MDAQGLAHTSGTTEYGYYLSDITSSDGRTLGYDAATHKYWQLFVNGNASEVGASSVTLGAGDFIASYYSAFGASLDDANKATVKASVSFIGPDENGTNTVWASATDVKMSDGSTAVDLTEQELKAAGLTYDSQGTSGASFYLASIARNGKTYGLGPVDRQVLAALCQRRDLERVRARLPSSRRRFSGSTLTQRSPWRALLLIPLLPVRTGPPAGMALATQAARRW